MKRESKQRSGSQRSRPLSLYPLSFDEAVTDILKVKPQKDVPRSGTKKQGRKSKGV
jgi:hypothetical protein